MNDITVTIDESYDSKTVKELLYQKLCLSSRCVKRLKYKGSILQNGVAVNVQSVLHCGDLVELVFPPDDTSSVVPTNIPIDIIYEDSFLLAVNKPSAMPTHPSIRHYDDTLANAVMYYCNEAYAFRAATRLDIDTTGAVLIAKNARVSHALCEELAKGGIHKEYLAVCVGSPKEKSGRIEAPISREAESIMKRIVSPDGKDAITDYEVIAHCNGLSLVRLRPLTGRTHQIRVHMSHIGHPLYGDYLYGTEISGVRTLLHCSSLTFTHPETKESITIKADLPHDIASLFPQKLP